METAKMHAKFLFRLQHNFVSGHLFWPFDRVFCTIFSLSTLCHLIHFTYMTRTRLSPLFSWELFISNKYKPIFSWLLIFFMSAAAAAFSCLFVVERNECDFQLQMNMTNNANANAILGTQDAFMCLVALRMK